MYRVRHTYVMQRCALGREGEGREGEEGMGENEGERE